MYLHTNSKKVHKNAVFHTRYGAFAMAGVQGLEPWARGFGEAENRLTKASEINKFPILRLKSADISATKMKKQLLGISLILCKLQISLQNDNII